MKPVLLLNALLIVLSIVASVLVCELLLRRFSQKQQLSVEWLLYENNKDEWVTDENVIFITNKVKNKINNVRNTNKKLLVALGDSFMQGDPVKEQDNFPSILQQSIQNDGKDFDVINLGVGGYGPDQEFRLFYELIKAGNQPDVVIWSFYNNDIYENITQPTYDIDRNLNLIALRAKNNWIYKRQRLFDLMPLPRYIKTHSYLINRLLAFFENQKNSQVPHANADNQKSWAIAKLNKEIDTMEELSQKLKFKLMYVLITPQSDYIPVEQRGEPARWIENDYEKLRYSLRKRRGLLTLDFKTLLSSSTSGGVLGLTSDLKDTLFSDATKDPLPMGVRHFNKKGYFLFAQSVYQYLKDNQLLEKRSTSVE